MKISDINYNLPKDLIAKYPISNQDNSRMMVINRKTGSIEHKHFRDFISYMSEGDCVVNNNSRVEPYLFYTNKYNKQTEIKVTLIRELNADLHMWDVSVEPARKMRRGNKIMFADGKLVAEVLDNTDPKIRTLKFLGFKGTSEELKAILEGVGDVPIPKELGRKPEEMDKQYYQTIFATETGGIITPYSGLHFSLTTLRKLELKDVNCTEITLHIGLNSLSEIPLEDASKYNMDAEKIIISDKSASLINESIQQNKKICAIGTSVVRAIESATSVDNRVSSINDWRSKFIYLPQQINVCDMLLTNFHLPKTVPMVIAASFAGTELLNEAYQVAIREKYNFFVYGDSMLII